MFRVTIWFLALTGVLARSTDFKRSSATIIAVTKRKFLCDATLITYNSAVTSCECATHKDFIFPEFLKKKSLEYNLTTRRSADEYGYQSRRISNFLIHPKCTSNNMITGFFSYNYAIVRTENPFDSMKRTIVPVELPALDYTTVNLTLWKALSDVDPRCEILGWIGNRSYGITVNYNVKCEVELCKHLGRACPSSLEEKGLLCLSVHENYVMYDYFEPYAEKKRSSTGGNWQDESKCTNTILSGSPLICYGFIMGIIAPGLCTTEVPVVAARIEPALEFLYNHIEMEMSTAAVLWPLMVMKSFSLLLTLLIS